MDMKKEGIWEESGRMWSCKTEKFVSENFLFCPSVTR